MTLIKWASLTQSVEGLKSKSWFPRVEGIVLSLDFNVDFLPEFPDCSPLRVSSELLRLYD